MPTRYLKPGIRDSAAIDALSPMAECLFYRLLVTVDDYGRYDARPALIKAQCFPVKESVTVKKIEELLAELAAAGLLHLYTVDGKPYLQLEKWDNKARATDSKFPPMQAESAQPPTDAYKRMQVRTDVNDPPTNLPVTVTVTGTVTGTESETGAKTAPVGAARTPFDDFWESWPQSPHKGAMDRCKASWGSEGLDAQIGEILAHVRIMRVSPAWTEDDGKFIPSPLTYLTEARWRGSGALEAEAQAKAPKVDTALQERLEAERRAVKPPPEIQAKLDSIKRKKVLT